MFAGLVRSRNSNFFEKPGLARVPKSVLSGWIALLAVFFCLGFSINSQAGIIGLGGKCLDVQGGSDADGTPIILYRCQNGANQNWQLQNGAIVGLGGKCLDVQGGRNADGTPIILYHCHTGANQHWQLQNGSLVGLGGKCLDVIGGVDADGTPIDLYTCHGGVNQQWQISDTPAVLSNDRSAPTNPIELQEITGPHCQAFAPAGWRIQEQNDNGSIFTLISGDDRLGAGYIILFIGEPELLANPEYGNPETAVLALLSYRAGQPIRATGQSQDFYGAHVFTIEGAGKQGYVLYHYYAHTPDQGYTLTIQVALSDIERSVSVSGAVASSIVCNTALRPPSNGYYHVETANPLGTSEKCKKQGQCNDFDLGGTYNVQLGTGWVHSSSGQNYLVDVTTDYRNDGPEGPGYYRQNGNNLEKLEPGFN